MNNRYICKGKRTDNGKWVEGEMKYEVRDVVCDYGVYENGELKLILESRLIAEKIVELLKEDERKHTDLSSTSDSDEQIIKAMEYCCGNIKSDEECSEDMCYQASLPEDRNGDTRWCRQWLIKDALELIERQKAKINELKRKFEDEKSLRNLYSRKSKYLENALEAEKSEAIKEFAERLKSKLQWDCELSDKLVFENDINNLVKEMTEVQE